MSEPLSAVRSIVELEQPEPSASGGQQKPVNAFVSNSSQRNDEGSGRWRSTSRVSGVLRRQLKSLGSRMPSPTYTLENSGSVGA